MNTIKVIILAVVAAVVAGYMYINNDRNYARTEKEHISSQDTAMSYRLAGSYSRLKYIQVDINGYGKGQITYAPYKEYAEKNGLTEQRIEFTMPEQEAAQLSSQYDKLNFFKLEVEDLNKKYIRVTDVGTTTFTYCKGGTKGTLVYGYVKDENIKKLVQSYRAIINKYSTKQSAHK